MGASDQVARNLISGGTCGMQIPFQSAAGVDNFDYSFVSAMALNDILSPSPLWTLWILIFRAPRMLLSIPPWKC